jgi:hypothetical protein
VRAVVTPRWKEDAERELSNAISGVDQQLAQLEQEGQSLIDEIRRQSANPLDPRVQDQVGSVQQQVAATRAELEEQKRQVLADCARRHDAPRDVANGVHAAAGGAGSAPRLHLIRLVSA